MNIIQRNITYYFYYKKYVSEKYQFLKEYGFEEMTDKKSIMKWGTDNLFKKGDIIISIGYEYKEERFITYFFDQKKIKNLKNSNYGFYLEEYLSKYQNIKKFRKLTIYRGAKDFFPVIELCSKTLKEYIIPIMEFLESEEWKNITY